jgi:D-aminopeptidase
MSPLFQAVSEATKESVYNAMLQAVSTTGTQGHRLDAISALAVDQILSHHDLAKAHP